METLHQSPTETSSIKRSTDTPADRVAWHLACIEARRAGQTPPPAPWDSPAGPRNQHSGRNHDSLAMLSMPERPTRATPAQRPVRSAKTEGETPHSRGTPGTFNSSKFERTAQKPEGAPIQSLPTSEKEEPLPFPPRLVGVIKSDPAQEGLIREKHEIVSSLLLRAGVPKEAIALDNRAQVVIDGFLSYLREASCQPLHKYNIGRQFIIRGGVREANLAAEILLPVLGSTKIRELNARAAQAEERVQAELLPINIPGERVEIPKR